MKRIAVILLCILLCTSIVGCTANTDSPISSTPTASTVSVTETVDNEKQTEAGSSETTGVSVESVSDTAATSSTDKEVPPATDRPTSSPKSEKTDTSKKPDISKPEASAPTESEKKPNETRPQETKPEETKPQETTPPKDETKHPEESKSTEPEQPADPYAYPFDINQIRRDCIAQGKSYGFTLDESLTPNNSSWSGAETASANTQGTRLKRFLNELVEYYSPAYRESMGLPEVNITAFNIYVEDLGNNTYRIYFLFLL